MSFSHEMKPFTVDDFAKHAELAGQTLTGFIRYDESSTNFIYFNPSPQGCPQHPISKNLIESVQLLVPEPITCNSLETGPKLMFLARVVLKPDAPGGEGLANLVVALAATLKSQSTSHQAQGNHESSPCGCGGKQKSSSCECGGELVVRKACKVHPDDLAAIPESQRGYADPTQPVPLHVQRLLSVHPRGCPEGAFSCYQGKCIICCGGNWIYCTPLGGGTPLSCGYRGPIGCAGGIFFHATC